MTPFETYWSTLDDPSRRKLIEGYLVGPIVDVLMQGPAWVVEMAIKHEGYVDRDYVKVEEGKMAQEIGE